MDKLKIIESAEALAKGETSNSILRDSLSLFDLKGKKHVRIIPFILLEAAIAIIISKSVDTITRCEEIIGIMHSILLAILAATFTGYALFQALIGEKLLLYMISLSPNKKEQNDNGSYLKIANKYFADYMMGLLLVIVLDLFIRMFLYIFI